MSNKIKKLYHKVLDLQPREWERIREHASQLMGNQQSEMWDAMPHIAGTHPAHLHFLTQTQHPRHAAQMLEHSAGALGSTLGKLIDHHKGGSFFSDIDKHISRGLGQATKAVSKMPMEALKFLKQSPEKAKQIAKSVTGGGGIGAGISGAGVTGAGFGKTLAKGAAAIGAVGAAAAGGAALFREYLIQNPGEAAKILAKGGIKALGGGIGAGVPGAGLTGAGTVGGAGLRGAGTVGGAGISGAGLLSKLKPNEIAKHISNITDHGVMKDTKQILSHVIGRFKPAEHALLSEVTGQLAGKLPSKMYGNLVKKVEPLVNKNNYRNVAREFRQNVLHQKLAHKGGSFLSAVKHGLNQGAEVIGSLHSGAQQFQSLAETIGGADSIKENYPTLYMIANGLSALNTGVGTAKDIANVLISEEESKASELPIEENKEEY